MSTQRTMTLTTLTHSLTHAQECKPNQHPIMLALTTALTAHNARMAAQQQQPQAQSPHSPSSPTSQLVISRLRELYPKGYVLQDLAQHRGMIVFPYQVC